MSLISFLFLGFSQAVFAEYTPVYSDGHGCTNMDSQFVGTVRTDKDAQGNYTKGYATITIPAGACPEIITFASYDHNGTLLPYENQRLHDSITAWYGPGTHEIGPLKITCNFQTDLYFGSVINTWPSQGAIVIPGPGVGGSIFIAANAVEHQTCTTPTPPNPPPTCTSNCNPPPNPCPSNNCNNGHHYPQPTPTPTPCQYCGSGNNWQQSNYYPQTQYNQPYYQNYQNQSYQTSYQPCSYCNSGN